MNDYPDRLWRVSTGLNGLTLREYAAKECKTIFRVNTAMSESRIKKSRLGTVDGSAFRNRFEAWCTYDQLPETIVLVREHARVELGEKIKDLQNMLSRVISDSRRIEYEEPQEPGPVTDDMF